MAADSMLVTVIGRGHGGTRAIARTLRESGVWMGSPLNASEDLVPAERMYEACRIAGRRVRWLGGFEWDFSGLLAGPVDPEFERLVRAYLEPVLDHPGTRRGWKLPETTLVFPWIVRMFPDAYYIIWWRDPRDNTLRPHLTDDLSRVGIPFDPAAADDPVLCRVASWKYQTALIRATPRPSRCIDVRFEDFVLRQEETVRRLEEFLGFPLARIPVNPESVGRWRRHAPSPHWAAFAAELADLGYPPG